MEPSPLIRICRHEDLRALEWDGLFTHHREIFDRTYAEQLAGRQAMLVAEIGGSPKGQAWIDLAAGSDRRTGIIWAVRVHPDFYGHGVGTLLLQSAETVIREHGMAVAELVVECTNAGALRLYQRLGYVVTRRVEQTYSYTTPDGAFRQHRLHAFEMQKDLSVS